MSYQCICFNFHALNKNLDSKFRFTGTSIDEIRCKNGSTDGVCPSCRKGIWPQLAKAVSGKNFQPDKMLKELMGRAETHNMLCRDVPRYVKEKQDIPNVVEHNKKAILGIHTLIYQNYVLHLAEEQTRVMRMLVDFRKALEEDIVRIKSLQSQANERFESALNDDR